MGKEHDRHLNLKKYDHLYDLYGAMDDGCIYCGDIASQRDHVPPISYISSIDITVYRKHYKMLKVPCCPDCNVKLSSNSLLTINDRKRFVRDKVRRSKFMKTLRWDEDELNELHDLLRVSVEASMKMKDIYESRYIVLCSFIEDDPTLCNNKLSVATNPRTDSKMSKIQNVNLSDDENAILDNIEELYKNFEHNFRWKELSAVMTEENRVIRNLRSNSYYPNILKLRDSLEFLWHG